MMNYYDSFDCQIQCEEYYYDDFYGTSCYNANEEYDLDNLMTETSFYEEGF